MSSLSQFDGRIVNGRVGLICYLVDKSKTYLEHVKAGNPHGAAETIQGTHLPVLYQFFRRPSGMMGQWVVFRYNGEEHVPDLSIPISLEKLPVGAKRVKDQAALRYWLDDGAKKPITGLAIHRYGEDDAKLDTMLQREPKYDFIPGTLCHRLYEYEVNRVQGWHEPIVLETLGVVSFEVLPPGSTRIPDQAALRFWLEE